MKHASISIIAVLVILTLSPVTFAQMCGDASNDGELNIQDFTTIVEYVRGGTPASFDSANADCDGILGISISDVERIVENIFQAGGTFDCALSGSYSFSAAPNDTIYLPRLLTVPDSISAATLLLVSSFSSNVEAFYVPVLGKGSGGSSHFVLTSEANNSQIAIIDAQIFSTDSSLLWGTDLSGSGAFNGSPKNLEILNFSRQSAGTANIVPEEFDRSSPNLFAVLIGNDLHVPVVQYYDAYSPDPFIITSRNIFLNALEDSLSSNSTIINLDFPLPGVRYELEPSDPWIVLSATTGNSLSMINVSGDATGLTEGTYAGTVAVQYEGINANVDLINVEMAVGTVVVIPFFPPGDANCDGSYDILDLTYTVDYVFRDGPPAFPCE